jgi:hypothetical protein
MIISYITPCRPVSCFRCLAAAVLLAGPLFPASGEAPGQKNCLFMDLNPAIVALLYLPMDIRGFGIEGGYERNLGRNFGAMTDTKYLCFSIDDSVFRLWDLSVQARYALWKNEKNAFFTSVKIGALLYDSPYFSGGTFLTGLEISWRKILGRHFLLEPYINVSVCADDRHLMPFTAFAATELFIPGFNAGARLGFSF